MVSFPHKSRTLEEQHFFRKNFQGDSAFRIWNLLKPKKQEECLGNYVCSGPVEVMIGRAVTSENGMNWP